MITFVVVPTTESVVPSLRIKRNFVFTLDILTDLILIDLYNSGLYADDTYCMKIDY